MNKTNSKILVPAEFIERKIYFIRGQKVMLDSDLAKLYGVSTSRLNEAVKRNVKRFPKDFMFQLTFAEGVSIVSLKSQIATLKKDKNSLMSQIVDIKKRKTFKIRSLCLYRTRCSNAFQCFEQQQSH